jgi:hypothetical protein
MSASNALGHVCSYSYHTANSPSLGFKAPEVVGEIGPGTNIGFGLTALMTGSKEYMAFTGADERTHGLDVDAALDQLAQIKYFLANKDKLPDQVRKALPRHSSSESYLNERVTAIASALQGDNNSEAAIFVQEDWMAKDQDHIQDHFDYIFSHQVMEHVMNALDVYLRIQGMLKTRGVQSHSIDFTAHGQFPPYANGHYEFTRRKWERLIGFRDPVKSNLNALPPNFHKCVLASLGNEITLWQLKRYAPGTELVPVLPPDTLIPESEADVSDCWVEAVKVFDGVFPDPDF